MNELYKSADEAWEAGNQWVNTADRWEMLDYLMESASPELKDNLINEMVKFMRDYEFTDFFNHLRRNWDIKTPQELAYLMEH